MFPHGTLHPYFGDISLWGNFVTDSGTEELGHMEIVSAIVYQLVRNLSADQIRDIPFATYYIDHTLGVYPQAASGTPFSAATLQSTGDPIADLHEDLAAEQKARLTYDNILRLVKDPEVADPIRFLRAREIVHYQRFGEANREDCSDLFVVCLMFSILLVLHIVIVLDIWYIS